MVFAPFLSYGQSENYGLTERPETPDIHLEPMGDSLSAYDLELVFPNEKFENPVYLTTPKDNDSILYIANLKGEILKYNNPYIDSSPNPVLFLDIKDRVKLWGEAGFLCFTFHPDFKSNGKVFVSYSSEGNSNDTLVNRVSQFTLDTSDPAVLDPESEIVIFEYPNPTASHHIGQIEFGPEGYLYIGVGDPEVWPQSQSQDVSLFGGKILRVQIPANPSEAQPYLVPPDNPFAEDNTDALPEIWALGFRYPWRFSFDFETGKCWAGDVGGSAFEEINEIKPGKNYGWPYWEGDLCHSECDTAREAPIFSYSHENQIRAVIGGYVYQDSNNTDLLGKYIFGDFLTRHIFSLSLDSTNNPEIKQIAVSPEFVHSFGQDGTGKLYILTQKNVYRLFPKDSSAKSGYVPELLSETGIFSDITSQTPVQGFIPYGVNAPAFENGARVERYVSIPKTQSILFHDYEAFEFPDNTFFIQNLFRSQETESGTSESIIETRILSKLKAQQRWEAYNYLWNNAGNEAYLLRDDTTLHNPESGLPYHYAPSRQECSLCHNPGAGNILGFRTTQLNGNFQYLSVMDNQIRALNNIRFFKLYPRTNYGDLQYENGKFMVQPNPADKKFPLEDRVKSYLSANCAHCHFPDGPARFDMDFSYPSAAADMNLIEAPPLTTSQHNTFPFRIAPGRPDSSYLLFKLALDTEGKMPPINNITRDSTGINLMKEWISSLPRTHTKEPNFISNNTLYRLMLPLQNRNIVLNQGIWLPVKIFDLKGNLIENLIPENGNLVWKFRGKPGIYFLRSRRTNLKIVMY